MRQTPRSRCSFILTSNFTLSHQIIRNYSYFNAVFTVEKVPNTVSVTEHKHERCLWTETKTKAADVYVGFRIRMLWTGLISARARRWKVLPDKDRARVSSSPPCSFLSWPQQVHIRKNGLLKQKIPPTAKKKSSLDLKLVRFNQISFLWICYNQHWQ